MIPEWIEYWLTIAMLEIRTHIAVINGFPPEIERSLAALQPPFQERAKAFLAEASETPTKWTPTGTPLRVDETYRTFLRQSAIHEKGDVTSAAAGKSRHEQGLAFDAWPVGIDYTDSRAGAILDALIPIAAKHGLKNLASIGDHTHWEDA